MLEIQWTPPYYDKNNTLPFVPTKKEVDALISGCSKKIATILLAMKETGLEYLNLPKFSNRQIMAL